MKHCKQVRYSLTSSFLYERIQAANEIVNVSNWLRVWETRGPLHERVLGTFSGSQIVEGNVACLTCPLLSFIIGIEGTEAVWLWWYLLPKSCEDWVDWRRCLWARTVIELASLELVLKALGSNGERDDLVFRARFGFFEMGRILYLKRSFIS